MAREMTAQSSKQDQEEELYLCDSLWIQLATMQYFIPQTTPLSSTTYDSTVQLLLLCIVLHSLKQVLSGYALMNAL